MGTYTQYFVITSKGKISKKVQIYMYAKLNHFATHLKTNTALEINYASILK